MRQAVRELTDAEFEALTRHLGLDPDKFDMGELRHAYHRLRALMARLEPAGGDPDAESLAVFDPTKAL